VRGGERGTLVAVLESPNSNFRRNELAPRMRHISNSSGVCDRPTRLLIIISGEIADTTRTDSASDYLYNEGYGFFGRDRQVVRVFGHYGVGELEIGKYGEVHGCYRRLIWCAGSKQNTSLRSGECSRVACADMRIPPSCSEGTSITGVRSAVVASQNTCAKTGSKSSSTILSGA